MNLNYARPRGVTSVPPQPRGRFALSDDLGLIGGGGAVATGGFVVRRLLRAVTTLLVVVTVAFIFLRLSGDPVRLLLSLDATEEQVEALRADLGLDAPVVVQYFRFLSGIIRGDLGDSILQRRSALALVLERLPATLELAAVAFGLALLLGPTIGIASAIRHRSVLDRFTIGVMNVLQGVPSFVVAILLILVLTVWLGWLPSSGRGEPQQVVMPAASLAVALAAGQARLVRAVLLDVLRQDYVRTARAKGLRGTHVIRRHALRNAALPVVTVLGLDLATLLGGAVIVETVFAWPGVGRLVVDAVAARDYPVVQAAVLVVAAIFVGLNVLVDLSYGLLDPRVRDGNA